MLFFPQLSTGAVGQYPIQKRRLSRTVVNEALGGARVKLPDPNASAVEWTLDFQALSDNERDALAQLSIEQDVNGPGWFQYAFSVQARSDQDQQLILHRSTATQTQSASFAIGS